MQQHERANKRRTAGAGKGTAGEQQENSRSRATAGAGYTAPTNNRGTSLKNSPVPKGVVLGTLPQTTV